MIVEDEFGNDIDLIDLDDDRDPEPPDPELPLSLEEIEAAQQASIREGAPLTAAAAMLISRAIPEMLDELRYWRAQAPEPSYSDEPPF